MAILNNAINANSVTPLILLQGGTSASLTASNGGLVYSTASAMAILAGTATANQVPLSGSSAAPTWSTFTITSTFAASTLVYSNGANTLTGLATANSASLVTTSAGVPVWSSTMTNGQVIIGSTGATPTANTLTAGTGISITNGAGSITIANSAPSSMWSSVSVNTALVAGHGYFLAGATQRTFTLPATAVVGDTFQVASDSTGTSGFVIAQNAGQQIQVGNTATTSGATGTITSAVAGDWIEIVCSAINNSFVANIKQGELTVA